MADNIYNALIYEPTAEFVAHAYLVLIKYYIQHKAHCLESYMVYFEVYTIIYYLQF